MSPYEYGRRSILAHLLLTLEGEGVSWSHQHTVRILRSLPDTGVARFIEKMMDAVRHGGEFPPPDEPPGGALDAH
jgi:hypothetical protein